MSKTTSRTAGTRAERNPLYIKIGKRIRQARLMARESNSRDLSLRLGWSAGRIHNYETGLSTPGVEETLQFCAALGVDPCWITYGSGAPRPAELHSARYRNFIDALDKAERDGRLEDMLEALRLDPNRLRKFRRDPYVRIPDVMARRCEKFLGQRRGWIDREPVTETTMALSADARSLMEVFARLDQGGQQQWLAIGHILAGETEGKT